MALIVADISISRYKAVTGETRWQAHVYPGGNHEGKSVLVDGATATEVMDMARKYVVKQARARKVPW